MKKNISVSKFFLLVFILTLILSYGSVATWVLNFDGMKDFLFINLINLFLGFLITFVFVSSFLSLTILVISVIKYFFYRKDNEKKIIIVTDIKKYFWLLILNFVFLMIIQLIFHPFSKSVMILEKPVIYLYPENTTNVSVKVNYQPGFLATYPSYNNGWNVIAHPDGKLINVSDGKEYSYLYWEGKHSDSSYDLTTGFVVKGEDTVLFLQDKLVQLGLTPKEYNEFIVYWLPQMVNNPYNLIHFATNEEYNQNIPLEINPTPDSVLRVFMVFKPLNKYIIIKPQSFVPFTRNGFTVVEWGGSKLE